jgi:hypothetical protein
MSICPQDMLYLCSRSVIVKFLYIYGTFNFYTFSDIPPDLFDPSRLSKRPQSELSAQTRLGDAITAPVGLPFSGRSDGTRVGAHVFYLRAGSRTSVSGEPDAEQNEERLKELESRSLVRAA